MRPVHFSLPARGDLAEIGDYIAMRDPVRAHSFVEELVTACEARGQFPHSGRRRSDVADDLWTFPYGRYLIVYSVEPERVLIRRVLHGARRIGGALDGEAGSADGA